MTAQDAASTRHSSFGHPVVDIDGHWIEFMPVFREYVREQFGSDLAKRFEASPYFRMVEGTSRGGWFQPSGEERWDRWSNKGIFWGFPTKNTLDRATAMLPGLLAERLDDMGIDVAVLYPTVGMHIFNIEDVETMQGVLRAFNTFTMEQLSPYSDRIVPVAMIPMETPQQALDELDHAVNVLGYKAVLLQQFSNRLIPSISREIPDAAALVQRPDYWGLDSAYDYDPVWRRCTELGVAATFHALGRGPLRPRGSVSNQVYNRVGSFGYQHHRLASALFLGGVSRRFPQLNIAFLEGGVAWAAILFADLVGIWSKRNVSALADVDPANLDEQLLFALVEKYGDARTVELLDELRAYVTEVLPAVPAEELNEFTALKVVKAEDLSALFCSSFYFGCEGDDAMNALAFRSELLPFASTLKACFGSDIGHWDVPDMTNSVHEAYEPVEEGLITADEFRDFVFTNPVELHGKMNPDFFRGTRVEAEAAAVLSVPQP